MKVKDFAINWDHSGLFTCCESHITECEDEAHAGMVITCEHCNAEMILKKSTNNKLMWCLND